MQRISTVPSIYHSTPHSRSHSSDVCAPVLFHSVQVVPGDETTKNRVLYDLQFLHTGGGDHLLVVSGDPGVLVYKWSDFLEEIDATSDADCECAPSRKRSMCQDPKVGESSSSRRSPFVELRPITRFRPHPSPSFSGESVEINSTSYGKSDNVLFGAAGDAFGCYQWDLSTGSLLGTFGGARGGHRDYLHVVKSFDDCVLTGGEDGCIGFWDGKCRKLIEMVSVQSTMEKNKSLVTSDAAPSNTGFLGSNSSLKAGSSLYVSSMDTSGNWLAACGGSESTSNNILSSRSSSTSAGFMTLWHLPSRSFTSGRVTRESLNTVASNQSLDCFVSGGNEGRISFWESASLTRAGRSWCTPPATYTMSVDPESNWMVLGGSGGKLDCFVDRVKVAQLQLAE